MSAIRIPGPDGRILLRVIDDGASPRPSGRGGGPIEYGALVVGVAYPPRVSRFVDDVVMKNPDNGAVEASITEVQP